MQLLWRLPGLSSERRQGLSRRRGLVESIPGSGIVVRFSEISDVTEALQIFLRQGVARLLNLHEVKLLRGSCAVEAAEVVRQTAGQLLGYCANLRLEGDMPRPLVMTSVSKASPIHE